MIKLGEYNRLSILRDTPPGLFLGDEDGNEILLPNKFKPATFEIGDILEVFVYLDNEERPISTTQTPDLTLNTYGYLKCSDVNKYGTFMQWGVDKQLFVPFKEQARKMRVGNWYIVYLYLDEVTNRLVGSSKTDKFVSNVNLTVEAFEEVHLLITHITDLGVTAIINGKHSGLIYLDDVFEEIRTGDRIKGFISNIRPDKKIDLVLQRPGYRSIEPNAEYIYEELKASGGFLPLHDKSTPQEIQDGLGLSKKSFKKAIGALYKDRKIKILDNGIELIEDQKMNYL